MMKQHRQAAGMYVGSYKQNTLVAHLWQRMLWISQAKAP
jgi:hypothetical protein